MNLCFPLPACLTLLCCETEKKEKSAGGKGEGIRANKTRDKITAL